MSYNQKDFSIPIGVKKIIIYYLCYSFLFFLIHLCSVSVVSFFHFLIDHDMHIIENWLYLNAWELVIFSKLLSGFIIIKFLKLNNYYVNNLVSIFRNDRWKPSFNAGILICFLSVFYFALIIQFGTGVQITKGSVDFFYMSFLGSTLFYLIDFVVISLLLRSSNHLSLRSHQVVCFSLLVIFFMTTKITLPYKDRSAFLLVIHFLTLMIMYFKEKKNMMNIIFYVILIVGPLSSVFGFDLIWENVHSVYKYQAELPIFGLAGIWLIGIVYYLTRKNPEASPTRLP